jgi:hypothetical protein
MMETIDLVLDQDNELLFNVKVEGAKQATTIVRLVCESADQVHHVFVGKPISHDVVQFKVPPMTGRLDEGTYAGSVEVLIENRYFRPVNFNLKFKTDMKVVAEVIEKKTNLTPVNVSDRQLSLRERYEIKKNIK